MKNFLFISILSLIIVLSGCAHSKNDVINTSNLEGSTSRISATSDSHKDKITTLKTEFVKEDINSNIQINGYVTSGYSNQVNIYQSQLQIFDIDVITSILLKEKAVTAHDENVDLHYLTTEMDDILVISDTYINFSTQLNDLYLNKLINWTSYLEQGTLNIDVEQKDLPFATLKEIENKFSADMKAINLNQALHTTVYPLSSGYLSDKEYEIKESGYYDSWVESGRIKFKDAWDETDNYYLITAEFMADENSVSSLLNKEVRLGEFTSIYPSYIWAIYSANGIEYLNIQRPYTSLESNQTTEIIAYNEALMVAINKFDSIISNDKFVFTSISLVYIPKETDQGVTLMPAWNFEITQIIGDEEGKISKGEDTSSNHITLLVDASTGKEII